MTGRMSRKEQPPTQAAPAYGRPAPSLRPGLQAEWDVPRLFGHFANRRQGLLQWADEVRNGGHVERRAEVDCSVPGPGHVWRSRSHPAPERLGRPAAAPASTRPRRSRFRPAGRSGWDRGGLIHQGPLGVGIQNCISEVVDLLSCQTGQGGQDHSNEAGKVTPAPLEVVPGLLVDIHRRSPDRS